MIPTPSTAWPLGLAPSTGESHCSALSLRCILLLFSEPLLCFLCLGSSVSCPQAGPIPISPPTYQGAFRSLSEVCPCLSCSVCVRVGEWGGGSVWASPVDRSMGGWVTGFPWAQSRRRAGVGQGVCLPSTAIRLWLG